MLKNSSKSAPKYKEKGVIRSSAFHLPIQQPLTSPISPPAVKNTSHSSSSARHVSPRKFYHQQKAQQQSTPRISTSMNQVPWNPAWLSLIEVACGKQLHLTSLGISSRDIHHGPLDLETWLSSYDHDVLLYESLAGFAQVKMHEMYALSETIQAHCAVAFHDQEARGRYASTPRHSMRLRTAVIANLLDHLLYNLSKTHALSHLRHLFLKAREEIFHAVYVDYDPTDEDQDQDTEESKDYVKETERQLFGDNISEEEEQKEGRHHPEHEEEDTNSSSSHRSQESTESPPTTADAGARMVGATNHQPKSLAPRPLSFFMSKTPFATKLHDESHHRALRAKRHQVVLRRIVQAMYRSLGTIFHAWKMLVHTKREEKLNRKGAQLTAMVVQQKGLMRSVFVAWSKVALTNKVEHLEAKEIESKRQHAETIAELQKQLFLLRESHRKLANQVELLTCQVENCTCLEQKIGIQQQEEEHAVVDTTSPSSTS